MISKDKALKVLSEALEYSANDLLVLAKVTAEELADTASTVIGRTEDLVQAKLRGDTTKVQQYETDLAHLKAQMDILVSTTIIQASNETRETLKRVFLSALNGIVGTMRALA